MTDIPQQFPQPNQNMQQMQQPRPQIPPQMQQYPQPQPQMMMSYPPQPQQIQPQLISGQKPADPNTQVFVGDLDPGFTEEMLWMYFKRFGPIRGIKIQKDRDGRSKGFGFITFNNIEAANSARLQMNHERILNFQPIRVSKIYTKEEWSRIKNNNIFISNIPPQENEKSLESLFSQFGTIVSLKVKQNDKAKLGYGYLAYEKEEEQKKLMTEYENDKDKKNFTLGDQQLFIASFKKYEERDHKKNNLYLNNFAKSEDLEKLNEQNRGEMEKKWTEEIRNHAEKFGKLLSVFVKVNPKLNKPFAFVCFEEPQNAEQMLLELKKKEIDPFFVSFHEKFKQSKKIESRFILLKNLTPEVDKAKLEEQFKQFGDFQVLKIAKGNQITDRQYAIMLFMKEDEAMKFLSTHSQHDYLNKLFVGGKVQYITICLPRDQRRQFLLAKQASQTKSKIGQQNKNPGEQQQQIGNAQPMMPPPFPYWYMPMPTQQPFQRQYPSYQKNFQNNYGNRSMPGQQQPRPNQGGMPYQQRMPNRNPMMNRPYNQNQGQQFRPQGMQTHGMNQQPQQQMLINQQLNQGQQFSGQPPVIMQNAQINPNAQNVLPQGAQLNSQLVKQVQPQNPTITFEDIKNNLPAFLAKSIDLQRQQLGQLIFPRVQQHLDKDQVQNAPKITGMLIDFSVFEVSDIIEFLENDAELKERVLEAQKLIQSQTANSTN